MKISFFGGVGEVTGSRHLLEVDDTKALLDCGMFQGHRGESIEKNKRFPFKPGELDAVLLSHAHIDHSGGLPMLAKAGFSKSIHCTGPTQELCSLMLMDSAHLQEEDARFFNKIHQSDHQQIEPLYGEQDAQRCLGLFAPHDYGRAISISDKVSATFLDAGHVLGSAMIHAEIKTPKGLRRVLFTGDLGRRDTLLMHPPQPPRNVDYLLIESTYGDRIHDPIRKVAGQLTEVVNRAVSEKGKVLIPSFALERTQEIVFVLENLIRDRRIPAIPIFVDSPMAVNITEIFGRHLALLSFDQKSKEFIAKEGDPFELKAVRYIRTMDESKGLNNIPGPMVIISASGMCEGGRILHHLRNLIDKDSTTVLIVGFQAEGTLGRRLADGAKKVKIFGMEHEVWARIEELHTLSAHADKNDLLWFIQALEPRPRTIFLVHGDPEDRKALAAHLKSVGIDRVELPDFGQSYELN